MNSDEYCRMISHSLMNMGNAYRIRKAIEKTRAGKEVTLAYIGGSITQGAGAAPIIQSATHTNPISFSRSVFPQRIM